MRIPTAVPTAVIALVLVGCGDDEDSTTTRAGGSPEQKVEQFEPTLSPKEEIEEVGNRWAPLFAATPNTDPCTEFDEQHPYSEVAVKYMAQPACERIGCERASGETIKNCTPLPADYETGFEHATVEDVAIQGNRAAATFSNGEAVELVRDAPNEPDPALRRLAPPWLIIKVGGNAGGELLEAAGPSEIRGFQEQKIEQTAVDWAPLFAEDLAAACVLMYGQPLCEEFFGRVGEPPEVGDPSALQESFANATVERIEVKGNKAGVEFSNGELVEFIQGNTPDLDKGGWFVHDVGGNAGKKYFEP